MIQPVCEFTVSPSLPDALEDLRTLAFNLRWAWNHDSIELFRRLDDDLWESSGHNPVLMLGLIDQAQLEAAASDQGFLAHLDRVSRHLDEYMTKPTWFDRTHERDAEDVLTAYFSAEFGLTECLEIFAGGLGVLSGDHLKSASDLGLPLVGVGLLYQQGYFCQYLNDAGWQQERREENDFYNLPLALERDADGAPLTIEVPYPGRRVAAQIWRVQVGRIRLYLLDTNIPANASQKDRDITDNLYGGDRELRIHQELMLGVGGCRALEALGLAPLVLHLNEGHPAFAALERIRQLVRDHGLSFDQAREAAAAGMVFTTHTPVPAGHDYFAPDLVLRYFSDYAQEMGLAEQTFLDLGREDPGDTQAPFCMTTLGLRLTTRQNAVSRLHGETTRRMWQGLWPGVPRPEAPITHITNGVHFRSWISKEMNTLYDRYLGPRWREEPADREVWGRAAHIAPEELWRTHARRRERLVAFVRRRLCHQLERRGAPRSAIQAADEVLDPRALTIGFARRFATYKRAALLLRDEARLDRILNDPERPVQVIYAGKAHPQDEAGKALIARIVALSEQERFRRRVVFLEDYGMAAARYLVQGCDVWLNTPRRPHEASGTSGMKAAANGVLNVSTLDGWWAEAYAFDVGWAIGRGEVYEDAAYQDDIESHALYDLLERDIVPMFYDRAADGLPRRWIERVKHSTEKLNSFFNTHRMVKEYTERFYLPAAEHFCALAADGMARAKALAAWKARVREAWPKIEIRTVEADLPEAPTVGDPVSATARVDLGDLSPDDVRVEFAMGQLDIEGHIMAPQMARMSALGEKEGVYTFQIDGVRCENSGRHGYTLRVLPDHEDLVTPFLPGLIAWARGETT